MYYYRHDCKVLYAHTLQRTQNRAIGFQELYKEKARCGHYRMYRSVKLFRCPRLGLTKTLGSKIEPGQELKSCCRLVASLVNGIIPCD